MKGQLVFINIYWVTISILDLQFEQGIIIGRGVFSSGAMGALPPAIFGHFSTEGKSCGC